MAAAGGAASIASAAAEDSQPLVAPPAAASDASAPRSQRRTRVVRPRIDIDDQIREANRVSDLLKKMGQAAKTLKKSQTKAKQRLVKKAARLSAQDLERIAVLKRAFGDMELPLDDAASSCSSFPATSPPVEMGVSAMHETLKNMMKGVSGAEDVVTGLGIRYSQDDKRGSASTKEGNGPHQSGAELLLSSAKGAKRLASVKRLPSLAADEKRTDIAHAADSQHTDI